VEAVVRLGRRARGNERGGSKGVDQKRYDFQDRKGRRSEVENRE